jgi:hypothetical protein
LLVLEAILALSSFTATNVIEQKDVGTEVAELNAVPVDDDLVVLA